MRQKTLGKKQFKKELSKPKNVIIRNLVLLIKSVKFHKCRKFFSQDISRIT
jgi:hypothetical protein